MGIHHTHLTRNRRDLPSLSVAGLSFGGGLRAQDCSVFSTAKAMHELQVSEVVTEKLHSQRTISAKVVDLSEVG